MFCGVEGRRTAANPYSPCALLLLLQNKVAAGHLKVLQAHVRTLPYNRAELAAFRGNPENAVELFNRPYRARDKHGIDLEAPALQHRVLPYFRWMRLQWGGSEYDDNRLVRAQGGRAGSWVWAGTPGC